MLKKKISSINKKFKDKILKKINIVKQVITQNIMETFMILGLFFIILATFLINTIAGLYILGLVLCIISIFLFKFPVRR